MERKLVSCPELILHDGQLICRELDEVVVEEGASPIRSSHCPHIESTTSRCQAYADQLREDNDLFSIDSFSIPLTARRFRT